MAFYAGETIVLGTPWFDKDEKPVVADPSQGVTVQVMTEDEATEILPETAMTLQREDLGNEVISATATAGAALTLTDANRAWTVDQFVDAVVRITAGTGSGQQRRIKSNTATVLTVTKAWTTNPDATSVYEITKRVYEYSWASPATRAEQAVVAIFRVKDDAYKDGEKLRIKLEKKI